MYFPALTSELLIQRCEEVFDRPRDCSPVRRVLVFGVIFELCIAYSEDEKNPSLADRFSGLARKFIPLLKAAISGLPLIIQPSMEAVIATTIAVIRPFHISLEHKLTKHTYTGNGCSRVMQASPGNILDLNSRINGTLTRLQSSVFNAIRERPAAAATKNLSFLDRLRPRRQLLDSPWAVTSHTRIRHLSPYDQQQRHRPGLLRGNATLLDRPLQSPMPRSRALVLTRIHPPTPRRTIRPHQETYHAPRRNMARPGRTSVAHARTEKLASFLRLPHRSLRKHPTLQHARPRPTRRKPFQFQPRRTPPRSSSKDRPPRALALHSLRARHRPSLRQHPIRALPLDAPARPFHALHNDF